jgi:lysophospholipase L1-like esterase
MLTAAHRVLCLTATAAALACAASAAAPAPAGAEPHGPLLALGDSFSSGEGGGSYDPAVPVCDRSPQAWPRKVAGALGWPATSVACSGAIIDDILTGGRAPGRDRQLSALESGPAPGVVTLTIGGNDAGFASVLRRCATQVSSCVGYYTDDKPLDATIDRVAARLPEVYRAIERRLPDDSELMVMGYPRLFPRAPRHGWLAMSAGEMRFLNAETDRLDDAIRDAAAAEHVRFFDVRDALDGHEVTAANEWLNVPQLRVNALDVQIIAAALAHNNSLFHPTGAGYGALARSVRRRLQQRPPDETGGLDPRRGLELALRFRPRLWLDLGDVVTPGEPWRPLDVDGLLAEGSHRVCHRHDGADCDTLGSGPLLQRQVLSGGGAPPFMEVDGQAGLGRAHFLARRACGTPECGAQRIYYHASQDRRRIYLDYWWYLRFNDADGGSFDHQSDWEGVVVAVDRQDPTAPLDVGFAQHTSVNRYPRAYLSCNEVKTRGTCGTAARPSGERINVFLARGTHAAYPTACVGSRTARGRCAEHDRIAGVPLPEGDHDGLLPWEGNEDPAALAALGPWAWWPGMWDPDGNVESPAEQPRFREPSRRTDRACPPDERC